MSVCRQLRSAMLAADRWMERRPMSEHASIAAKTRQGRQGRRAERAKPAIGPAYITRRIPDYELLSEEGLAQFDRHADLILQEIGMEIRGDEVALALFKGAGDFGHIKVGHSPPRRRLILPPRFRVHLLQQHPVVFVPTHWPGGIPDPRVRLA